MFWRRAVQINSNFVQFSRKIEAQPNKIRQLATAYYQLKSSKLLQFIRIPINSTAAFLFFSHFASKKKFTAMAEESTIDNILQNADQLFDENHYQEVLEVLEKYWDKSSPDIKWRKARAMYSHSKTLQNKDERAQMVRNSYELIQSALEDDDNNFAIHKWMAIIMDANAELDGIKARLSQIEDVQKHMNRAVELNPEDPTSWYLLGAFEFNLADLPWIQRKIVSALFATPPNGSYEKALEYFKRAESKKPGFYSTNWLMIAKCYIALKNNESGKEYLDKAANCRVLNEDDRKCKQEAEALLKRF